MYSREIDGKTLTLAASGWTYDDTFVLHDKETESLWYPLPGEPGLTGITGEYADRKLGVLPSTTAPWSTWVAEHPNTRLMSSEGCSLCGAP